MMQRYEWFGLGAAMLAGTAVLLWFSAVRYPQQCAEMCAADGLEYAYYDHNHGRIYNWECACVDGDETVVHALSPTLFGPADMQSSTGCASASIEFSLTMGAALIAGFGVGLVARRFEPEETES